jgi:hypothetical protein
MRCDRCHVETIIYTLSKFNVDNICLHCATDERQAPGYRHACQVEEDQVRQGNYNFRGVGLSFEDQAFLTLQLANRKKVDANES